MKFLKFSYSRSLILRCLVGLFLACSIGGVLIIESSVQNRAASIEDSDRVRSAQIISVGALGDALVAEHIAIAEAARGSEGLSSTFRPITSARGTLTSEQEPGLVALSGTSRQEIKRYVEITDRIASEAARGTFSNSGDHSTLLTNENHAFVAAYADLKSQQDALASAARLPPGDSISAWYGAWGLVAIVVLGLLLIGIGFCLWIETKLLTPLHRVETAARNSADRAVFALGDPRAPQDEIDVAVSVLENAAKLPAINASRRGDPVGVIVSRRAQFEDELSMLIERCQKHEQGAVLALLRIRFFDRIAAAYGSAAAEAYSEAMLERLSGLYSAPARVFRYQRNLLAVVKIGLPRDEIANSARELADIAMHGFKAPVRRGAENLWSEAHIALALFPRDANSATGLLRAAMATLETVSNDDSPGVFQSNEQSAQKVREQMLLAERVRDAIMSNEFQPYFQPIVDIAARKVKSVELLARWPGSSGLASSPSEFVQIAEDSDQAWQLSTLLFVKAAQAMKSWRGTGLRVPICINVSATLITPRLPGLIQQILQRTGMPADLLQVEITETAVFQNPEEAQTILRDLAALGVQLTLDDFGTGYSSLSYLLKLPISKIKIDQTFVSRILEDRAAESIVRATINLANSLGHGLVAEGIATRQISERMAELGCTVQQGFFFSPGLPPPEAIRWVKWWESPHHSQNREPMNLRS